MASGASRCSGDSFRSYTEEELTAVEAAARLHAELAPEPEPIDKHRLTAKELDCAFEAVRHDRLEELLPLVKHRKLKACHLRSKEYVNEQGMTLHDFAMECSNRRAINYFNNNLICGPSFYYKAPANASPSSLPYVSGFGANGATHWAASLAASANPTDEAAGTKLLAAMPAPLRESCSVLLETSSDGLLPGYALAYPDLPEVMQSGHTYRLSPIILHNGQVANNGSFGNGLYAPMH